MPPAKRQKVPPSFAEVELNCLGCINNRTFKGSLRFIDSIPVIRSRGLTTHILMRKDTSCLQYYTENKLYVDGAKFIFTTSLKNTLILEKYNESPSFTASQIGLTKTGNGPVKRSIPSNQRGRTGNINSILNQQVTYDAFQPKLPRDLIEAILFTTQPENHNKSTDEHDEDRRSDKTDNGNDDDSNKSDDDNFETNDGDDDDDDNKIVNGDGNHTPQEQNGSGGTAASPTNRCFSILKVEPLQPPGPNLTAEIELMNIMRKHKLPLNTYKEIYRWATTCQNRNGFDFASSSSHLVRARKSIFKDIHARLKLPADKFQIHAINWLPDNVPTPLSTRPFKNALQSLLSNSSVVREENLSFPDASTPYSPVSLDDHPDDETIISELHHGGWWAKSWKEACDCSDGSKEILVPIILYMDGISLDAHGRLTLTPLNMTLGIFNIATRRRPDAWETLYFHPDAEFLSSTHSKKAEPIHNIQNLHNGLRAALQSFKEVCEADEGIIWDELPYAGKTWKVKMKFCIAYVIGDTELHDKLCGRYGSRGNGVKQLCRHCNCPNDLSVTPRQQVLNRLWKPDDFNPSHGKEYFNECSHHKLNNIFHDLDFGAGNPHNIHLATPGECLHMHQLGSAKRAVESFEDFVMGRIDRKQRKLPGNRNDTKQRKLTGNRKDVHITMGQIAREFGASLTRQSDRDFPRTKYTTPILTPTKKEGNDYAGILLCLIISMVSGKGRRELENEAHLRTESIDAHIRTLELIVGMEEFLKHGYIKKKELESVQKMVIHYLNEINLNCQRSAGMGTRTIKNHLYFHLHDYIRMWGPPAGWDSAPSESHHKTEIKAPSKNTQRNASTFIQQTADRQLENRTLQRASNLFRLNPQEKSSKAKVADPCNGAKFTISLDHDGQPSMAWTDSRNRNNAFHPKEVLEFCCDEVIPLLKSSSVKGFTEHRRIDVGNDKKYIFRSSPSYRDDSGQVCSVWYDWAIFDNDGRREDEEGTPAQILCLLDINNWRNDDYSSGQFAVVRKFDSKPRRERGNHSGIVWNGKLLNGLFLLNCDTILETVAVVQNKTVPVSNHEFLVVRNREFWLESFQEKMAAIGRRTFDQLYKEADEVADELDGDYFVDDDNVDPDDDFLDGYFVRDFELDGTVGS